MADDDLPDSFEPGTTIAQAETPPPPPKGDVRIASWVALIGGAIVVVWYLSILVLGGVYFSEASTPIQIGMWALAVVSFVLGIVSLNARRARELAAAGFIAGVVALLVTLAFGVNTGIQILI